MGNVHPAGSGSGFVNWEDSSGVNKPKEFADKGTIENIVGKTKVFDKKYPRSGLSGLKDRLVTLITGKDRLVPVTIRNSVGGLDRVYIDSKKLEKMTGISRREMTREAKEQGTVDELIAKETTGVIKKYEEKDVELAENIDHVVRKIGDLGFLAAIGKSGVDTEKMLRTLGKIGKDLSEGKEHQGVHGKKEAVRDEYGRKVLENDDNKSTKVKSYGYSLTADGNIYIRTKKLGEGSFKKVVGALDLSTFKESAVQLVKGEEESMAVLSEDNIVKELKDIPHVVPYHTIRYFTTNQRTGKLKLVAFMEKFDGDGEKLIEARGKEILFAAKNMGVAVAEMHKKGYVHADLKPANLLIKRDEKGQLVDVRVSDFGLTEKIGSEKNKDLRGTSRYMAPEQVHIFRGFDGVLYTQFRQQHPLKQTDNFGYGMTLVELLLGQKEQMNIRVMCSEEGMTLDKLRKEVKPGVSFDEAIGVVEKDPLKGKILDIALQLIDPNPHTRMTAAKAVEELNKLKE